MSYVLKFKKGPLDGQKHESKGLQETLLVVGTGAPDERDGVYRLGIVKNRSAEMHWVVKQEAK